MSITPEMLVKQKAALKSVDIPRAPKQPPPPPYAMLGLAGSTDPKDWVKFQYNPSSIVITHTAPTEPSAGKPKTTPDNPDPPADTAQSGSGDLYASVDEREKAKGTTTLSLKTLTFDGKHVARVGLLLLSWTHFVPKEDSKSADKSELPRLKFVWGPQAYLVRLNSVTVTYTRFSRAGMPVRATVDLTLHSIPKIPGMTNPSSGGLPDRRVHTLTGAECLPSLATRFYGGPGDWRRLAAANGIDDPLRVRPGALVYVPNPQELLEG